MIRIIPYILFTYSIFYSIVITGQPSFFLKTYASTSTHTVFLQPHQGMDTMSQNSFVTGGLYLRVSNTPNDTLDVDGFLQKTEVSGLTKWHKKYHLNGYKLSFKDIKVLHNNDILVGGFTNEYATTAPAPHHGTLLRTDSNGYVKWFRLYPFQRIYKLLVMKDGDIVVLTSDSGTYNAKNLKVALLDPLGNLKWCKKIYPSSTNGYRGGELAEGKDKRILLSTYSFLILLDSSGNKINDLTISQGNYHYKAVNYFDECFYIVGTGYYTSSSNIGGSILKVDNSLNVRWYKLLQSQFGNSEFMGISIIGRNNLLVFNEPENYGSVSDLQRSGFTFIDSNGVSRKNYLFTSDSFPMLPKEFILLKNGHVLFTCFNPLTQFFGITDTVSNGFCKYTNIDYSETNNFATFVYNSFTTVNSSFSYSLNNLHLYMPLDAEIKYICSSGPTGPLDSLILPPKEDTTFTNTFNIKKSYAEEKILLYPNPANDFVTLGCLQNENRYCFYGAKISLINSIGEIINTINILNSETYIKLETKNILSGIYYLKIEYPNKIFNYKKLFITH